MKRISYNKLVRDRIPELIESTGKTCTTETLSPEDYLYMIDPSWQNTTKIKTLRNLRIYWK